MHKILSNKVLLFISALLLLSNIFLVILLVRTKDSHKAPPRDEKQRYPLTIFLDKELSNSRLSGILKKSGPFVLIGKKQNTIPSFRESLKKCGFLPENQVLRG
jgi:hypothetical protein